MGLDYSFELVFPRAQADRAIAAIAAHLEPEDRERLIACNSIRETWITIAKTCSAFLLLLDDERNDIRAIWPVDCRLGLPIGMAGRRGNELR